MTQTEIIRPRIVGILRMSRWRAARGFVLPFLGMTVGAGMAVVGLFRPPAAPLNSVPAGYVALVNQRPILMNDFVSQTEATEKMPFAQTTASQRRDVLHAMIDEELLVQRALALDLPEMDTDVRKALVDSTDNFVGARILAQTPTEKDLRDYFNANYTNYTTNGTMNFHDIVLHVGGYKNADQTVAQAAADAQEAVYQLRSGARLEDVMQHFGFENSGKSDGSDDLDFAVKLHLGPQLFAVASQMKDGEISDPQIESDGVHILIMEKRVPPRASSFDENRERVLTAYQREQTKQALQQNLQLLRGKSQILLAPGQAE